MHAWNQIHSDRSFCYQGVQWINQDLCFSSLTNFYPESPNPTQGPSETKQGPPNPSMDFLGDRCPGGGRDTSWLIVIWGFPLTTSTASSTLSPPQQITKERPTIDAIFQSALVPCLIRVRSQMELFIYLSFGKDLPSR